MGADIDHAHGDVEKDLLEWGAWIVQETGNVGFRFDAIKVRVKLVVILDRVCLIGQTSTFSTSTRDSSPSSLHTYGNRLTRKTCSASESSGKTGTPLNLFL